MAVGDPGVDDTVDGAVADLGDRDVPERGQNAQAPAGHVGIEGLRFESAHREGHDGLAVVRERHRDGVGVAAGARKALHASAEVRSAKVEDREGRVRVAGSVQRMRAR